MCSKSFRTKLIFFKNDPIYKTIKPYGFKFPPENGFPATNITSEDVEDILVQNIRSVTAPLKTFTLQKNGFTVMKLDNPLSYDDYFDHQKLKAYFEQLETWAKHHLGASKVEVFRHHIRKRHVNWPHTLEPVDEFDQPTTQVHIDATVTGCLQEMSMMYGSEYAERQASKHFQWFNFWKPLRAPPQGLNDWPLLLCDASSVNAETDTTPADLIYPTYATENTLVMFSPEHLWYYLSDQKVDEVLVFKQADSDPSAVAGVPHCSVRNPLATINEPPRESIEVRAMVFFD